MTRNHKNGTSVVNHTFQRAAEVFRFGPFTDELRRSEQALSETEGDA